MAYRESPPKMHAGFTMVEVIVMAAVIMTLTAIIVGGFPVFNENALVRKEAERLALEIRNTQSNAILGRVALGAGATPLYWGLHAESSSPGQYIIFADINGNRQYNAGVDEILKTVSLENGVAIVALESPSGAESELNFFFIVPYGDTEIFNAVSSVGSWGKITLASPKRSVTRTVTVRISGQISIANN